MYCACKHPCEVQVTITLKAKDKHFPAGWHYFNGLEYTKNFHEFLNLAVTRGDFLEVKRQ